MKPILVFQTDFTYQEGAVSAMYGVVKTVDRELEIITGSHEIPKYDIYSASYRLFQTVRFWPQGTIFVSVVDPGVGTKRKSCVAKTFDGYYIVTPDNGSLTHLKQWIGIEEVREIDETINRLRGKGTEGVAIFHGRDVFGYTAAKLASGIISFEQVGESYPVSEIVEYQLSVPSLINNCIEGCFEINDPNFGNLWTNIPKALFDEAGFFYGDWLNMVITHQNREVFNYKVLYQQAFGYVKIGEPVIYNNELMKIGVAVCQGSFTRQYAIGYGQEWLVKFTKGEIK